MENLRGEAMDICLFMLYGVLLLSQLFISYGLNTRIKRFIFIQLESTDKETMGWLKKLIPLVDI